MSNLIREKFIDDLRDALNHLYNADTLRESPLADLFGLSHRFESSTALRKTLLEAIDTFKPSPNEPEQSRAWRVFDSLFCCYVQQLSQQIVADQLCISPRQLRREQRDALEALADYLWDHFQLEAQLPASETAIDQAAAVNPQLMQEFAWLKDIQLEKPTLLSEELPPVLELIQTLIQTHQIQLENQIGADLPPLAVHPVVLNQILVNTLSALVHQAVQGEIVLSARPMQWTVELTLSTRSPNVQSLSDENRSNLEFASQLADLSGGRMSLSTEGLPFQVRLALPSLEQMPVLVIDDNSDTLQLFKRYSSGSRYRLICTTDPGEGIKIAEKLHPQIIILDIMMPQNNGWMVLGRLRQTQPTSTTPIIICSILPQEKLALSLGANAFLKKPVARQDFLTALDQQSAAMGPIFD